MRALILTCSTKHPKLPLRLFEQQLVAGPHWPDAQTMHGLWRSLRTSAGDYDVAELLAKIPAIQYPDVILCLLDGHAVSRPRNLQCFPGRKILVAAQGAVGSPDFNYGDCESFDHVVGASNHASLEEMVRPECQPDWEAPIGMFDPAHVRAC